MDRANIEKLNKIISLFKSDKNIELELKYNEIISKDTYEKIIDIYKNKGLKYEEKTTLDIIFIGYTLIFPNYIRSEEY